MDIKGKSVYIEDEYIQNQFRKNFINGRSDDIIIYGTGIHTQKLLESLSDKRIVGLMDAKKTGETLWGKKVLSYDEAAELKNICIVIVARNSVVHVIFRRIEKFVTEHGIPVFDINGNQILSAHMETEASPCFALNRSELEQQIRDADVVSFDIFDTLLCRCVLRPADVFRLMDRDLGILPYVFSKERICSERDLEGTNPTIHDIYKRFQERTSETEKAVSFMKQEIETEKKVLRRRESMCQLLGQAVEQGKKVLLISDMYFTKDIMEDLLTYFDIRGYDELYISCECGCSKADGLFEAVKESENIRRKWLHIGDNSFADIQIPLKAGISTYQIYSTTEMLERSIYGVLVEQNNTLEENVVIAGFASEAFQDPFGDYEQNGKLKIADERLLAKLMIAPVVFKYMVWLVQNLQKDAVDFVLFPSRDGYLLKRIYDLIRESCKGNGLPESIYFYTSRRAALVAAAETNEDVKFIAEIDAPLSIADRVQSRFEITVDDWDDGNEIPKQVYEFALKRSQSERKSYLKYIKSCIDFDKKKIALIDFVSVGTVHEALQRITGKRLKGYYFLRRMPDTVQRESLDCSSLYGMYGDFQMNRNIYRFYYIMEAVLTSYEPTFRFIDENGKKYFYEEHRTSACVDILRNMHDAIIQYCSDQLDINLNIWGLEASVDVYDYLLGFFSLDYSEISEDLLKVLVNVDEFMEKKITEINR